MAPFAPFSHPRDRRVADRTATSLRAKLFPGAIDCVVADFSKRGARLRFAEPLAADPAPARLILVIWASGLAFEVEPRWRTGTEIGVQFVASRDLRRPAPPHLAEIQAMWMKRRPRVPRRKLVKSGAILDARPRARRNADWMRPRSSPPM